MRKKQTILWWQVWSWEENSHPRWRPKFIILWFCSLHLLPAHKACSHPELFIPQTFLGTHSACDTLRGTAEHVSVSPCDPRPLGTGPCSFQWEVHMMRLLTQSFEEIVFSAPNCPVSLTTGSISISFLDGSCKMSKTELPSSPELKLPTETCLHPWTQEHNEVIFEKKQTQM